MNKSIEVESFVKDVLLKPTDEKMHLPLFASILASQNGNIAKHIFESQKDLLENISKAKTDSIIKKRDMKIAQFWLYVSSDAYVRSELQKSKLPLSLYDSIIEKDPVTSGQIMKVNYSEEYLTLLTEIILTVSAGCKELEDELSQKVIKDIEHLGKQRDMFFINKVLLALIRNEAVLPVCLVEKIQSAKGDEDWQPNFEVLSEGSRASKKSDAPRNVFLPSTLVTSEIRSIVTKGF